MRIHPITKLVAAAALMLAGSNAHAKDTDIGKKTAEEIKDFCDGVSGGTFTSSPDKASYGCASACTEDGKQCRVQCDKDTGCTVSIPRSQAPRAGVIDPKLEAFEKLSLARQAEDDGSRFPIGLIGLLGLLGLLGMGRPANRPAGT